MSTYAILGSTGNCGLALIHHLLQAPNAKVNAYCRNKTKLFRLVPQIEENKQVKVFEGSIQDAELLTSCIRDVKAVFLVLSTNDNIPGCRLGQDTAVAVISVLEKIRQSPKIVLLSSATIDDVLSHHVPFVLRQILLRSASHVYQDLRETEKLLREQDSWLTTIFIKPGALSVDVERGHALSLTDEDSPISYLDLAAGMIEAVESPDGAYDMRNVSIVNTNGRARFPTGTPMVILMGLLRHFFPFLHAYLPLTSPGGLGIQLS